ncbi:MAG: hypothetical protein ACLVDF_01820, partial [Acutalibacteraceae bacterium]
RFSLVGGKVIPKEGNRRNGFPLLIEHRKFYQEIQETARFKTGLKIVQNKNWFKKGSHMAAFLFNSRVLP